MLHTQVYNHNRVIFTTLVQCTNYTCMLTNTDHVVLELWLINEHYTKCTVKLHSKMLIHSLQYISWFYLEGCRSSNSIYVEMFCANYNWIKSCLHLLRCEAWSADCMTFFEWTFECKMRKDISVLIREWNEVEYTIASSFR